MNTVRCATLAEPRGRNNLLEQAYRELNFNRQMILCLLCKVCLLAKYAVASRTSHVDMHPQCKSLGDAAH